MIVVIAEKPSVAKTIANTLGCNIKKDGYFTNDHYVITWCYGHLVELKKASSYTDNPWDLKSIPIIPSPFELTVKSDPGARKQFKVINNLSTNADTIVNACDAGREGELIFRYVLELIKTPCSDFKRLWISSLTKQAISEGFKNLKDSSEYDNIYYSGKSRSQADWLIGINGTIALTRTIKSNQLVSLGRVQTPTFAMVCKRYLERSEFVSQPYFQAELELSSSSKSFKILYPTHFKSKVDAEKLIDQIGDGLICRDKQVKEQIEKQPLLFDLTQLQIKANTLFKFSSQKTLNLAQSLYERHKAISYPRTDSKYISEDMTSTVILLLNHFKSNKYQDKAEFFNTDDLPKKAIDDSKVSDHHAIIPTEEFPEGLTPDEQLLYDLVVNQFLACFSFVHVKTKTTFVFQADGYSGEEPLETLAINGYVIESMGWKTFVEEQTSDVLLPNLILEKKYPFASKLVLDKKTTPKPLLTESSLLKLMEGAGRDFEEEEIPKDIRSQGIGRPATRAGIIERLLAVNYIVRTKNKLLPTELGLSLFGHIKDFDIASVKLTGKWEAALNKIAEGTLTHSRFNEAIIEQLTERVLPQIYTLKDHFKGELIDCPKCKEKALENQGSFLLCNTSGCELKVWRTYFKAPFDNQMLKRLFSGETIEMKGLKHKAKSFAANVFYNFETNRLEHRFPDNKTDVSCPKCKVRKLVKYDKSYSCPGYKEKTCDFVVWKKMFNKNIPEKDIVMLILEGKTKKMNGFKSKSGKSFQASIGLDENLKVKLIF